MLAAQSSTAFLYFYDSDEHIFHVWDIHEEHTTVEYTVPDARFDIVGPGWSLTKRYFAWTIDDFDGGPNSNVEGFIWDRQSDTIEPVRIDNSSRFSQVSMSWSPTADLLLFYSNNEAGSRVSVFDPENKILLNSADVSGSYIYGLSWSPDGQYAVAYTQTKPPSAMSTMFIIDIDGNTAVSRAFQTEQIGDCQTSLADIAINRVIAYQTDQNEITVERLSTKEILVYQSRQAQPIRFLDLSMDGQYLLIIYSGECSSDSAILEIVDIASKHSSVLLVLEDVNYTAEDYLTRSLHLYRNAEYGSFWIENTTSFLVQTTRDLLLNSLSEQQIQSTSILNLQDNIVENIIYDFPLLAIAFEEQSRELSQVYVYDVTETKLITSIGIDQKISGVALDSHLNYIGYTQLGDAAIHDIRTSREVARISIDSPALPLSDLIFTENKFLLLGYIDPFSRAVHIYDTVTNESKFVTVCAYSYSCFGALRDSKK